MKTGQFIVVEPVDGPCWIGALQEADALGNLLLAVLDVNPDLMDTFVLRSVSTTHGVILHVCSLMMEYSDVLKFVAKLDASRTAGAE